MEKNALVSLQRSLSPVHACALAIGCIIGWTAFHEPGAAFLVEAGPVGTLLAIGIAAAMMIVIVANYGFMVNRFPVAGGEFSYARAAFGRLHSFICAWFLALAYLTCIPLNATAIGYIAHKLFSNVLMSGPHWTIVGYDVYLSQVAIAILVLSVVAALCIHGVRDTGVLQTILVLVLVGGVAVVAAALALQPSIWAKADPALHPPLDRATLPGFASVLAVTPCLFVGFDTVPQGVEEFAFHHRHTRKIMVASILVSTAIYVALVLVAAAAPPAGGIDSGTAAFPAFHAAHQLLGGTGIAFLCYATLAGVLTGILGFLMAESRLLWAMAREGIISPWFGRISPSRQTPCNAILFTAGIAILASLIGRGMLVWLVDLCSLGAVIGYGYTSAAAFRFACREGKRSVQITGAAGVVFAAIFAALLIIPIPGLGCAMKPHSWACLAVWVALGALLRFSAKLREKAENSVSSNQ